jgi:hypothetical protein
VFELFHAWVEELAHVGSGTDIDLPDVKSAILAFKVCAFYRHFGKYFSLFAFDCLPYKYSLMYAILDICDF